jgi:hypothetical protein
MVTVARFSPLARGSASPRRVLWDKALRLLGLPTLSSLGVAEGAPDELSVIRALLAAAEIGDDDELQVPSNYVPSEDDLPAQLANFAHISNQLLNLQRKQNADLSNTHARPKAPLKLAVVAPAPAPTPPAVPQPQWSRSMFDELSPDDISQGVNLLVRGR